MFAFHKICIHCNEEMCHFSGAHYKKLPSAEELPKNLVDVFAKSVSINSSYATRVIVSY